jgi:EAL domain-containing protein (putative c-di-GMP-specific phosphodiesterase class I)
MQAAVSARAALDTDLRTAIAESQFVLHYQPQVDGSGRMTGAEALLRWQHPRRGHGDAGGIHRPGRGNAPDRAARALGARRPPAGNWPSGRAAGTRPALIIAVNVSSRQFHQADFVDQVMAVLAAHRRRPAPARSWN